MSARAHCARAVIDKQSPTVGLGNPVSRVSNGLGAVQIYNFDNINLVQAVTHIWRQWVTDDSGLNWFIVPAVTALGLGKDFQKKKRLPRSNSSSSETKRDIVMGDGPYT